MELELKDVLLNTINAHLRDNVATSLPGKIVSVREYGSRQFVDVELDVARLYTDGELVSNNHNVLYGVPIIMPGGGGGVLTFPVQPGETVDLHFCMRNISSWKLGDGTKEATPSDSRHYSFNDAIATPGLRTASTHLSPSTENVELKFGDAIIRLLPTGDITIDSSDTVIVNGVTHQGGDVITQSGVSLDQLKLDFEELKLAFETHGSGAPSHPPGPV